MSKIKLEIQKVNYASFNFSIRNFWTRKKGDHKFKSKKI